MLLAEGTRVKTRDGKEGTVVAESYDLLGWLDVMLDKKKTVLQYAPNELTVIDQSDVVEIPKQTASAIFSNQLVRLQDGRTGFTQKNRISNLWDVYVCQSQKVERHADWRLTPVHVGEPIEPKPSTTTALVPISPAQIHKEATFKRSQPHYADAYLMLAVIYTGKYWDSLMLFGGAVKEINRLRRNRKPTTAITPINTQEIIIEKPIKQSNDLFTKAVQSGKFTADELKNIGDAHAVLTITQMKLERLS